MSFKFGEKTPDMYGWSVFPRFERASPTASIVIKTKGRTRFQYVSVCILIIYIYIYTRKKPFNFLSTFLIFARINHITLSMFQATVYLFVVQFTAYTTAAAWSLRQDDNDFND